MSLFPPDSVKSESSLPATVPTSQPGFFAAALTGARRWWPFAGLAGLIFGGGAAASYYLLTPQKHTVAMTLQVSALDPLLFERVVQGQDLEYRKAQAALVRTRQVLQKAVDNPKVTDPTLLRERQDPAGWLEIDLKTLVLDGGLIRVSLTGEKPEELAITLNEIAKAYLNEVVDAEEKQRRVRAGELNDILVASEARIRSQKNVLRELAKQFGTSDITALSFKQQTVLQKFAILQTELLTLESKLRVAGSQVVVLKKNAEASKTDPLQESLILDVIAIDPVVKPAADEVHRLTTQLEKLKDTVTPGSAAHQKVVNDLKSAEARLATVKEQRRKAVRNQAREAMIRQAANALAVQEANENSLKLQWNKLEEDVKLAKKEAEDIGQGSIEFEMKRAELAEAETILRKLRNEKERLAVEMESYRSRVRVLSPAEASAAKPSSSALAASAALGIAGLALGVLGVGYLESRRRRLVHSLDVSQLMKLRVFGNIPFAPGLESRPLTEVWGTRSDIVSSHLIEAINDVRTVLLAAGKARNHQVVILTSADQNEGKTTLACLLALSIAQIGKRTLLIDADLRNPRVADRLGLQPAAGFGELLRGEASPDGVIGMVPESPLAVITAGRACSNLIRGLSVERVNKVFTVLREQFDYIIVDSSPTTISDGLVIGACQDAALLVIRSGQTEEPSAREACQRMIASHVPLMGGILNGVPMSRRLRYPYLTLPPVANVSDETDDLPLAQETDETPDELPISG